MCKPPSTACPVPGTYWSCRTEKGDPLPGPKGVKGKGVPPQGVAGAMTIAQLAMAYFAATRGIAPWAVRPPDGPPAEAAPGAPDPQSPAATPGDTVPPVTDEELDRATEKTLKEVERQVEKTEQDLDHIARSMDPLVRLLEAGKSLNRGQQKALKRYLDEFGFKASALENLVGIAQATGAMRDLADGASHADRARMIVALKVLGEAAKGVSKGADQEIRDLGKHRLLEVDYEREDYHEAERLLRVARLEVSDDDPNAEAKRKSVKSARAELEQLGLDADDAVEEAGAAEVAALVNRRRINTDLREADELLARGTGFLGGVERGGLAAEKGFVELPHIWLQVAAGLATGDTESAKARIAAASGAATDVWKLLANRDTETVPAAGHRLAQSTLGAASLEVTDDERLVGEDPRLQLARELSLGVGKGTVYGHRAIQMMAGFKGLIQAAVSLPRAAAALGQSIRAAVGGAKALAAQSVEALRAAVRGVRSRLSGRMGSSGILPPSGAGGAADELATFFRAMGPEEISKFRATGILESHAQRLGLEAERGFLNWFEHSITSSGSPYKSMTTMPHIAEEWARQMGGQVVRITVPKSTVTKGFNVWQAEYLVPGGTRVLTFKVGSSLPLPSFGATAQWAAETGAVGVGAVGIGVGLGYVHYKVVTPDHSEATTEPGK